MHLCAATIVRNEAEIIQAFVGHNVTLLDHIAVVDHGSFDGTSEIVRSRSAGAWRSATPVARANRALATQRFGAATRCLCPL